MPQQLSRPHNFKAFPANHAQIKENHGKDDGVKLQILHHKRFDEQPLSKLPFSVGTFKASYNLLFPASVSLCSGAHIVLTSAWTIGNCNSYLGLNRTIWLTRYGMSQKTRDLKIKYRDGGSKERENESRNEENGVLEREEGLGHEE
ncbi:hypothetical protein AAG906_012102 [Vitis piasezkii]